MLRSFNASAQQRRAHVTLAENPTSAMRERERERESEDEASFPAQRAGRVTKQRAREQRQHAFS